ncbi:hypothetical protein MMC25_002581 [Agyrium rufum]|nr:hypothetical protein [Agyrium rufum]
MDVTSNILIASHELYARASNGTNNNPVDATRPSIYKPVGISLAIASGLFIGTSFIFKKVGLLKANVKYNEEAGEGMGYLKNAYWWSGMTLMIIGEICNFVAYAFVDAILVTPFGALSVVVTAVLSAIFLKERLSFVGKVGCFNCIIGSVVIVLNAPQQSSVANIQQMQHYVIAPGFLSYAGVVILTCLFIILWAGPRYGKRSMLVYLSVCSLIGGLSVVATQGLGAAIVAQIAGTPQFNQWFLYVLLVFVVTTLVTEIIYLNKALNIFNAALVTPTYYVFFTSSTIVSGAILFQGFDGTASSITTVVMGFLVICSGVVLLQLSKSAKDVPDTAVFSGDLDQVRTVAEQEQPESEPKADAIRGAAAIIRRISQSRGKWEAEEMKRVHEDQMLDQLEPIAENESVEWDGIRRRKTVLQPSSSGLARRKTLHPPLGLTHFPDEDEHDRPTTGISGTSGGFLGSFSNSFRRRAQSTEVPTGSKGHRPGTGDSQNTVPFPPLTEISVPAYKGPNTDIDTQYHSAQDDGSVEMMHVYGMPPGLKHDEQYQTPGKKLRHDSQPQADMPGSQQSSRPLKWAEDVSNDHRPRAQSRPGQLRPSVGGNDGAQRQFSFNNIFHRNKADSPGTSASARPQRVGSETSSMGADGSFKDRKGIGSRKSSKEHGFGLPGQYHKNVTEEERMGLVKGDSKLDGAYDEREEDEFREDDSSSDDSADFYGDDKAIADMEKEVEVGGRGVGAGRSAGRGHRDAEPEEEFHEARRFMLRDDHDDTTRRPDNEDDEHTRGGSGSRGGGGTGAFI